VPPSTAATPSTSKISKVPSDVAVEDNEPYISRAFAAGSVDVPFLANTLQALCDKPDLSYESFLKETVREAKPKKLSKKWKRLLLHSETMVQVGGEPALVRVGETNRQEQGSCFALVLPLQPMMQRK